MSKCQHYQYLHPLQKFMRESFNSCIRKHQTIIKAQNLVIKAILEELTDLQCKVKVLEEAVGIEDRFRNIIREQEELTEAP